MLDRAFEIKELLLNNTSGILSGVDAPNVNYPTAPLGSMYLRGNGTVYVYTNSGWVALGSGGGTTTYSELITVDFSGSFPGVFFGTIPNANISNLSISSKILSAEPINFIVSDVNLQNDVNSDSFYFLKQRFSWYFSISQSGNNVYFSGRVMCDSLFRGQVVFYITWN